MKSSRLICAAATFLAALVFTSARASTADYAKKLTMTVNPASVGYSSADVANVPVAVRLSESIAGFQYSDFLEENGGDLLFTDEGGIALPHEIEKWNTSGESIVWVRVPKFGAGRRIYAYYGGEAVAQNAAAVWSGYTGVWHMAEASGTVADATGNGLVAEPKGNDTTQSVATAGPVGSGRVNAAEGKSNRLEVPYSFYLDFDNALTFSGWVKMSQLNADNTMPIVMHKESTWDTGWAVKVMANTSDEVFFWGNSNADREQLGARGIPSLLENWVHVTVTYQGNTGHIYINGQQWQQVRSTDYTSNTWISPPGNNTMPLAFGYTSNGHNEVGPHLSDAFQGSFDEFRLSGGAKSAAHIAAEYAAQMPNVLTYSVGANDTGYAAVALANFTKSFTVTASGYTAGDTFADFPMLVRLNPANVIGFSYDDFIQSDYSDLAFFDASGNALAFDVDTWNASGESLVWVKVPSFAAGTVITCAYGGLVKNDLHQPATWSGYRGVWHLNETGDGAQAVADATANGMDGTSSAETGYVSGGQLGGSRQICTSRSNKGRIVIPFNPALNMDEAQTNLTVSAWVNLSDGGNWGAFLFSRMNTHLDPGWGMSFCAWEMNDLDYYYRGDFSDVTPTWTDSNGGYWQTFAYEHGWIGARDNAPNGTWHKYTILFSYVDGIIRAHSYFDGRHVSERWLYHGDGNNRKYGPLYQSTDRGFAIGGTLEDCIYSLNGAMDEVRLGNGGVNETREALEYAQETDADATYYTYSTVADVPGSAVPAVVVFGEAADATVVNDTANGKVVFTIPVNVASVRGGAAMLKLMVGVAAPKDGDPADLMTVVDTMNVSAAGNYNFVWNGALLGTKVAYKVVSDTVIDSTHTWTSETTLKTATVNDPAEYRWKNNTTGLWSDSANWTLASADDGLPRLGYPSYGSHFNVYGDSQTSEIQVDANYEGLASGSTLGWGGDNITFKGAVDGAAIGYPEGAGFKDGQYSNVKITLDNVALTCGSYHVYANSSLTMLNGASLNIRWEFLAAGDNASLFVGDGCELNQRGVDGDRFQFAGENASIVISNGVVKANTLRIGGSKDDDVSQEGKTPKGIFFYGDSPQLQILQYARIHADMGAELPVVFTVPETGYAATPIVKTGGTNREFAEKKSSDIPGLVFMIDRNSPFYSQRKATLEQTFIDWRYNGNSFVINANGLALKKPRGGEWTLGTSVLSATLDIKPSFVITVR